MSLTENSSPMYMPVAPAYGGNGFGGGFGDGGWWLLVLILAMFNGGWGGFGGGGMMWPMMMGGMDGFGLYPWLNNSQNINDGFRDQMLNTTVQGIQNGVTSGFGDVQLGIAGINQNICSTGNGISQQLYANEIASLNRSFAEQTANVQGFNSVSGQLAQCCCDNRLATVQTQNVVQTDGAATRAAIQSGVQSVLDKMCQLELDGVKQRNADLLAENNALKFAQSQTAQDGFIQNAINQAVARVNPTPIPAYAVQNPNCCNGNGFGFAA